jgi:Uma2 family endonuclease
VPAEKVRPLRRAEYDRLVGLVPSRSRTWPSSSPGDYLNEHPSRALLLIEVADSSLQHDRRIKGPLYAAAGVPEYWIVDVTAGTVEIHRDPGVDGYATVTRHTGNALLAVPGFDDVVVRVSDIVPPQRA